MEKEPKERPTIVLEAVTQKNLFLNLSICQPHQETLGVKVQIPNKGRGEIRSSSSKDIAQKGNL